VHKLSQGNSVYYPSGHEVPIHDWGHCHSPRRSKSPRECYVASLKVEPTRWLYRASSCDRSRERREPPTENRSWREAKEYIVVLVDLDTRLDDARMEAGEDLQLLPLNDDDHKTYIGSSLNLDDHRLVNKIVMDNANIFAWTPLHIASLFSRRQDQWPRKNKNSGKRGVRPLGKKSKNCWKQASSEKRTIQHG